MPIERHTIRNAYGLSDPKLYGDTVSNDPTFLLDGVAMAGYVGVLRLLGDLAQFSSEVFYELQDQVMSTSSRGHNLLLRVEKIELDLPQIEKSFIPQTNHKIVKFNPGTEWHPKLSFDQNILSKIDMPRFILDSFDVCRFPPQLHRLDQFDEAGDGACLKRFYDPTFFHAHFSLLVASKGLSQQENKTYKLKISGLHSRKHESIEINAKTQDNSVLQDITFEKTNRILALKHMKLKKRNLHYLRNNIRRGYIECVLADQNLDGIYFELDESPQTNLIDSIVLDPDIHDEIDADSESDISISEQKFNAGAVNRHEETDGIIRELDNYYKDTYKDSLCYDNSEFCQSCDGDSDNEMEDCSPQEKHIDLLSDVESYISDDADIDIDHYMDSVTNTEPVKTFYDEKMKEGSGSHFSFMEYQGESLDENKDQSLDSLPSNSFEKCYSTDNNIGMKQGSIDMKSVDFKSGGDSNSVNSSSESLRLGLSLDSTTDDGLKETGYPQLKPDVLSDTGVSEVSHGTDVFSDATEDDVSCIDLSTYQTSSGVMTKLHEEVSVSSENKYSYKQGPTSVNASNDDFLSFDCGSEDSSIKSPQINGKDDHVISSMFNQDLIATCDFENSDESPTMENEKTQNVTSNSFGEKEEIPHSLKYDVNCEFSNKQQVLENDDPIFSLNFSDRSFDTEEMKSFPVTTSGTKILAISHDAAELMRPKSPNLQPSRPVRIPGGVALPGMAELHKNTMQKVLQPQLSKPVCTPDDEPIPVTDDLNKNTFKKVLHINPVVEKTMDIMLEQIKNKSFTLKPVAAQRPKIKGPMTNHNLAAIIEKARTVRQVTAGSDDEDDSWED